MALRGLLVLDCMDLLFYPEPSHALVFLPAPTCSEQCAAAVSQRAGKVLISLCVVLPQNKACSCERVPGKQTKCRSPAPSRRGVPFYWQGCRFLCHK